MPRGRTKRSWSLRAIEACELRVLLSNDFLPPELVLDFTPNTVSSNPRELTRVGNRVFFVATTFDTGDELFALDLPTQQVSLVRDIVPGPNGSAIDSLTAVGNTLFFVADDGIHGPELWKSDGTTAGTVLVKDIDPDGPFSQIESLVGFQDRVYFSAFLYSISLDQINFISVYGLMRSDGTADGTEVVKEIETPIGFRELTVSGSSLFFVAGDNRDELWISDGTEGGTSRVREFTSTNAGPLVYSLTASRTGIYFVAESGSTNGLELWHSTGDPGSTNILKDINPGSEGSDPQHLTPVGSALFFTAYHASYGRELWRVTGTSTSSVLSVIDLVPGIESSSPNWLVPSIEIRNSVAVGIVLFQASTTNGPALWKSDGTSSGTVLISEGSAQHLSSFGGGHPQLFVRSTANQQVVELWKTDGSSTGTSLIRQFENRSNGSNFEFHLFDGAVYFAASQIETGVELWRSDSTPSGTTLVADVNAKTEDTAIEFVAEYGNNMVIATRTGRITTLWLRDPVTNSLQSIREFESVSDGFLIVNPIGERNGLLLFSLVQYGATEIIATGEFGERFESFTDIMRAELWSTDGTLSGTTAFVSLPHAPTRDDSFDPLLFQDGFTQVGDHFYFRFQSQDHGDELWITNGTALGTRMVKDIEPGPAGSRTGSLQSRPMTSLGSTLYFTATTNALGAELWRSDGTTDGTVIVRDINAGPGYSVPSNLRTVGNFILFTANDGTSGTELWRTDGTATGTVPVTDLVPVGSSFGPQDLTVFGQTLFFTFDDGVHGEELWRSDGTADGTRIVTDLVVGAGGSFPRDLTIVGGRMFFFSGSRLWATDGSVAGTVLVRDLGTTVPRSRMATAVGNRLFFLIEDSSHGYELWTSDGTAMGTRLFDDRVPGPTGSQPTMLSEIRGSLYYSAIDRLVGRELFVSRPDRAPADLLIFDETSRTFRLGTNTGTGFNWFRTNPLSNVAQGWDSFVGDFDGDGDLDGAVRNRGTHVVLLYTNNGDGTLTGPVNRGTAGTAATPGFFQVGDYDGNGRDEILWIYLDGRPAGLVFIKDLVTTQTYNAVKIGPNYDAFVTGDFNGDGFDDLAGLYDTVDGTRTNIIPFYSIASNNPNLPRRLRHLTTGFVLGSFGRSIANDGLGGFQVVDLNHDGKDDIVASTANGQIVHATTTGSSVVTGPSFSGVQRFVASVRAPRFAPENFASGYLLGRFDDNLTFDVSAVDTAGRIFVGAASLDLAFQNPVVFDSPARLFGSGPASLRHLVGDFNGDGYDDLVGLGANAYVYLSTGDGNRFGAALDFGPIIGGAPSHSGAAGTY